MNRPVHVLHVLEATEGGTRRWLENVVRGIDPARVRCSCICSTLREGSFLETVEEFRRRGVQVWVVEMRRAPHPVHDALAVIKIGRILKSGRFDVIHAHSSKAGGLVRLAARGRNGAPVVYTPHAFSFLAGGLTAPAFKSFERRARRWTGRLLAVSEAERAAALGLGYRAEAVSVIPNGVEVPAATAPFNGTVRNVGFIGSLRKQKDPLAFVAACGRVHRRRPDARFVLCGDGPLRHECQEVAADIGFGGSLRFTGWLDDPRPALDEMDLFVSCARYEGLSFALLDAMAAGKPVVATRVPGNEELIRDEETGLSARAGDAQAIADCIVRLIDDPGLARRLGERARLVVAERYTIQQQLDALAAFYESVSANGGGG
ncbi:MAG: glycosyltransferase [Candidatus Hydrogenedentes bacterium]|nr:glycosyltransferase [Candidatus Hydrogenedentota bacterium]